ncbi:Hpt domain-containing protein [Litoribacter ruber]|uniref:Hpt domain-containing protein n=1 Tax=Litoribacter ruber TaxID=702568 RepID=A0AAP2G1T8_9BACT|nr:MULTISPECIES: Hpt domain-containing protein [Litoribacter]MBS9525154.1 Hpt domain-containing protein [Litoribacter alkaliphilus]MBT0811640.1 Hpt domain-containing protein [Litoribacter ruber]
MYTIIHKGTIFHYFGEDDEMANQMVEVILNTNLKDLMELPELYEQKEWAKIKVRCHKGKSTMSYIGALQVRKMLEEIESDPETIYPQHRDQLMQDLQTVDEELRFFLNEQFG